MRLARFWIAISGAALLAACSAQEASIEGGLAGAANGGTHVPAFTAADPGDRIVLFGDLHLHTSYSLDAAGEFGIETTPDDAYRFAKGVPVQYFGRTVTRHVPLDFLAVTDHAEYLGNVRLAVKGKLPLPAYLAKMIGFEAPPDNPFANPALAGLQGKDMPGLTDPARVQGHWQDIIDAAQRHNDPGHFTAFVAFEYSPTSLVGVPAGLHRNVIFRGPDYPAMPFAATDSMHPEALWAYAETNRANGIDSLMIPHNTNLSNGQTYLYNDTYGEPIGPEYARVRQRNEPLVEITQVKGTSETRPELSPDDEFADFEPYGDINNPKPGSYVRSGLMRGLEMADRFGVNPFEQGFVGASDFHSGISASEEDNFPGALGLADEQSDAARILHQKDDLFGGVIAVLSASGITGVWADANTREAIFAALRRREVFATSGPRIRVRLFAGWGSPGDMLADADWARRAYAWGVPMGGNLTRAHADARGPSFVFQAAKDPLSGNLDRIQIVKLWREGGKSFEKIYDVAWSPGRRKLADGRLEAVGNTVDSSKATYRNTIGAAELFGTWRDPNFDPAQRATYYARVIEIPTPRWATYLAVRSDQRLSQGVPPWLQERAWTSPIYYTPAGVEE